MLSFTWAENPPRIHSRDYTLADDTHFYWIYLNLQKNTS